MISQSSGQGKRTATLVRDSSHGQEKSVIRTRTFKDSCLEIFYGDNTEKTEDANLLRLNETFKLLESIHPGINYSNFGFKLAIYSKDLNMLTLISSSNHALTIKEDEGNPAGLACHFSGIKTAEKHSNIGLVTDIWRSCGNNTVPTPRAAGILMKWAELKKLGFLSGRSKIEAEFDSRISLMKLVFETNMDSKAVYFKTRKINKWIPYGIRINDLASYVLNTGDLPNKREVMILARQFKKMEQNKNLVKERSWDRTC